MKKVFIESVVSYNHTVDEIDNYQHTKITNQPESVSLEMRTNLQVNACLMV